TTPTATPTATAPAAAAAACLPVGAVDVCLDRGHRLDRFGAGLGCTAVACGRDRLIDRLCRGPAAAPRAICRLSPLPKRGERSGGNPARSLPEAKLRVDLLCRHLGHADALLPLLPADADDLHDVGELVGDSDQVRAG